VTELPVNATDLVVLGVLLLSGVLALARGFVKEVLGIAGWVGAAIAALKLFPYVQPLARKHIPYQLAADVLAGAGVFLVVLVALSLISNAISRRVRESGVGALDRSLGFVFGLVRGALVLSLAYLALVQFVPPKDHPAWIADARSLPLVEHGAGLLASIAPSEIRQSLEGAAEAGAAARAQLSPQAPMLESLAQAVAAPAGRQALELLLKAGGAPEAKAALDALRRGGDSAEARRAIDALKRGGGTPEARAALDSLQNAELDPQARRSLEALLRGDDSPEARAALDALRKDGLKESGYKDGQRKQMDQLFRTQEN
jgi:membrane protein required for colicin V production